MGSPSGKDLEECEAGLQALGETEVRRRQAVGHWGTDVGGWQLRLVADYLREREHAPERAHRQTVEELAKESNDIARAANQHADSANRWAKAAAFGSVLAALVAIVALLIGLDVL